MIEKKINKKNKKYNYYDTNLLSWRRTQSNSAIDFLTAEQRRPTNQDIINIIAAIEQLMKQNDVNNAPDPVQNPFVFLWLANCVIYSVVVAFLVIKG